MTVTDKKIIEKRFSKSIESYNKQAVVQKQIVDKLSNLLLKSNITNFKRTLEIGCGTGFLTKKILNNYSVKDYILNDLVCSVQSEIQQIASNLDFNNYRFISGDAETTVFPENLDAVFSSSSFQWFNNLKFFISRMYKLLNNNGIIAFSTFGKDNYKEIKSILNVGLNYKTLDELKSMITPDFEIIHSEEWKQQEQFISPNDVLRHMKLTGVNGLKNSFFSKEKLMSFNKKYNELFSNKDKTVNLTYHPIIIIAKKKAKLTVAVKNAAS